MMRIAVVSGKGGSGKSSVASALIALSQSVIAVDCDVDASNLPLLFSLTPIRSERFSSGTELKIEQLLCERCGQCVSLCNYDALIQDEDGKIQVNNLLCEGCALCQRHCPTGAISIGIVSESNIFTSHFPEGIMVHGALRPGDDNSGKMVTRIREIADQEMEAQQVALQILDGPPGIGCPVLATLTGMDKILIVCEPTVSGISDLKRIYALAANYTDQIYVVINKYDIHPQNAEKITSFCDAKGVPVIGHLPFDRAIVEAQVNCQPIVQYAPGSVCSQELKRIYDELVR